MPPVVVIGTPCYGGLVTQGYMLSVVKLMERARAEGFEVSLAMVPSDALITRARSTIVAAFLDNPAATHLLFVDADIGFEAEQAIRLLRFDRDMVAGMYPVKAIDWAHIPERCVRNGEALAGAGLVYVGEPLGGDEALVEDGFAAARYAGTGFLMIKRAVLERLIAAHPEAKFNAVHGFPPRVESGRHLYALFDCVIDPATGVYLSEDYAFCRRWRALGGEIWLDLRSRLTHTGAYAFSGDAATRYLPSRE